MKTYRWILIVFLMLTLGLPATPVSAARSASIRLTPPTPDPGLIGGNVIFDLAIDATDINPGVAGAEIYLAYAGPVAPPVSPLGVAMALPDFFGVSDISIKEILPANDPRCNGNPCIHMVVAGPPQVNHSGAAARFFFRCIGEGTALFTVLASTLVDADGFQVAHTPASPVSVPCVFRATVTGKVLRQGTPASPNPGGGTLACSEVKLVGGSTTIGPVFTKDALVNNFELTNISSGTYTIHAEYSGYLASEKTITITNSSPPTIDVGATTLRGGDANGDTKINILDIGKIISLFGKTTVDVRSDLKEGCADPDEPTDINDDGNINISDLAITAGNWGLAGPTIWP